MNENLDLCKILEGCEGIELYSPLYGIMKLNSVFDTTFSADVFSLNGGVETKRFFKNGTMTTDYDVSECLIFPSKDQRDWSKFEKPIKEGTPMMVRNSKCEWGLAYYSHKYDGVHYVSHYRHKDDIYINDYTIWKYMIPYDKFDPNNIEESLKFNIQK